MRIAFILPAYNIGGPQTVVKILAENYASSGHYVKLFYFDDKLGNNFKCEVEKISILNWTKLIDFDIIHTHGIRPDLFVFLHKRKLSAKTISTLHCYMRKDLQYIYGVLPSILISKLWNLILIRQDKVVALSKHMLNYYKNFLFNKNISYVYNSVTNESQEGEELLEEELNRILELKTDFTLLGNISYFIKRKGLDQIISLLEKDSNLACLFVGDGPEKNNLEILAKEKKVYDRCYFIGFKAKPQNLLQFIDIYIMPSHTEGFPIAVLEAAIHKKAIVCSNLPVYNELFSEKEILTYQLNDINDLYNIVQKIKPQLTVYGRNVSDKVMESYMPQNLCGGYMSIYAELLKN
jgi:L-malate glycosyltransferase